MAAQFARLSRKIAREFSILENRAPVASCCFGGAREGMWRLPKKERYRQRERRGEYDTKEKRTRERGKREK